MQSVGRHAVGRPACSRSAGMRSVGRHAVGRSSGMQNQKTVCVWKITAEVTPYVTYVFSIRGKPLGLWSVQLMSSRRAKRVLHCPVVTLDRSLSGVMKYSDRRRLHLPCGDEEKHGKTWCVTLKHSFTRIFSWQNCLKLSTVNIYPLPVILRAMPLINCDIILHYIFLTRTYSG
jgi:hypothetical protein